MCERNLEFISRLISKCLRAGVSIEEIIDSAKSVHPCLAYVNRAKTKGDTSPGTSCPSAIGKALERFQLKINKFIDRPEEDLTEPMTTPVVVSQVKPSTNLCPECGADLQHEGGCISCPECGYSKCD